MSILHKYAHNILKTYLTFSDIYSILSNHMKTQEQQLGTDEEEKIDWSDPEAALRKLESSGKIPPSEIDGFVEEDLGGPDISEKVTCRLCIRFRQNIMMCCKHHPETGEVDPKTGLCPNLQIRSGLCKVYKTAEYPEPCAEYSCPRRKV